MKQTTLACDVSAYSKATPYTQAEWSAAKRRGCGLAIVGSWHGTHGNPRCQDSLASAKAVGLELGTYAVLNGVLGDESIEHAKSVCGSQWDDVRFIALDIEVTGVTFETISSASATLAHYGKQVCLYTGSWWWVGHMGNPTWGADLDIKLWTADYSRPPSLDLPKPYGGWYASDVIGHQFQGTNTRLGLNCDLSVFDMDWVLGNTNQDT